MSSNPAGFPSSPLATVAKRGLISSGDAPRLETGFTRDVSFSHCRVDLPSFRFVGREDEVSRLHRLALRLDPERPDRGGMGRRVITMLLHAGNAVRQSLIYQRKYGAYVRRAHGIGRWQQWCAGWTCLFRHNQLPRHYYERHLYNETDSDQWLENIEHRHLTVLLGALNRLLPVHLLENKLLFAEHCRTHDLQTVPVLAAWNGEGQEIVSASDLPAEDLFSKPLADYGGEGSMLICFDPIRSGYVLDERVLSAEQLFELLARRALGRGCVLQPRLHSPAPVAALFGDSDIANARIVTGVYPGGSPRLIAAGLRVPSKSTTSGHDRQALMTSISLNDGRLGEAHMRNTCGPGYTHHPDTGKQLAGVVLPRWREMVEMALAAHATCPWMPFVGWDVVDSDRGLYLLEANAYWGANVVQMPGAEPLGRTEFPAMYHAWHRHLGLPGIDSADSS